MSDTHNKDQTPQNHSKLLEGIIYILFLLGPLYGNVILVLFGVLSLEFRVPQNDILIAIPAFMFPFAIVQLFSGAISDIKGRIPVLILGLFLFGVGMAIAAFSLSLQTYVIANILAGIGFGFVNPVLIATLTDINPESKIARKLGYLGASATLGVGLGPFLASLMVDMWRLIYVSFIVINIFCLIVIILIKRPQQRRPEEAGISNLAKQLSMEWRRPVVIFLMLSVFLIAETYIAVTVWNSRGLTGVYSEAILGVILGFSGAVGAIAGVLAGIIIKKKGPKLALMIGVVVLLSSVSILIAAGDVTREDKFSLLVIGWLGASFAGGVLFPSLTYFSQILSPERRGALAGSLTAGYFIGCALVPSVYTPIFNIYGISGVYVAILIASVALLIVIWIFYALAKK